MAPAPGHDGPTRGHAAALDAADPLAPLRDRFSDQEDRLCYLDGNSLGRLPRATVERLARVVSDEWGRDLIRSWSHWVDLPRQAGDRLATGVLGASEGSTLVADSTTVNLFKLVSAAVDARPGRRLLVTDEGNFPTDRYVLEGIAAARDLELRLIPTDPIAGPDLDALDDVLGGPRGGRSGDDVAVVSLSHVDYRSAAVTDVVAVNEAASRVGALVVWDLSHAAGAVEVDLEERGCELAVGCTYKYLCGGPGAPAFLYVAPHLHRELRQPIWGWFGQQDQFAMGPAYDPVAGIERFAVGTPSILGLAAADEGIRLAAEAGPAALAAKSRTLTELVVAFYDAHLAALGFTLGSPRDAARRGGHVSLGHVAAWPICQALVDRGVVPDFRGPDLVRLGPAPLSTSAVELWDGLDRLRDLVASGDHDGYDPSPGRVT